MRGFGRGERGGRERERVLELLVGFGCQGCRWGALGFRARGAMAAGGSAATDEMHGGCPKTSSPLSLIHDCALWRPPRPGSSSD